MITVRVDDDEMRFTVTLGPPPDLFWFRAMGRPPKLGQKLAAFGEVVRKENLGEGKLRGTLSQLELDRFEVLEEPYPTRFVPEAWLTRVRSAMKRPLFRYQLEGSGWLASRLSAGLGAILADDPGVGKSAQTVAALCASRAFPVVVVCPASLKGHWAREFFYAAKPPHVTVIHGVAGPFRRAEVYIINYDVLRAREATLLALRPRLYVFDEAQEVKHPMATGRHRAAVATRLSRQAPNGALCLTGTPLMNRPSEMWRLLHLADPKTWPAFEAYQERYLRGRKGHEVGRSMRTAAGKVERLDELQAAVAPVMLRRMKHQVLKDLPPKSRRSVLVELDDASMAHYRRAETDVVGWLRALGKDRRAIAAMKAQSLVKLTMLRRIASVGKLRRAIPEYLRNWFRAGSGGEPLVIFGYHTEVMLGIWKICASLKLRATGIGGSEGPEKRQRAIDAFQRGLADVFLAPIKSAGVGLNLQRASESLFVERIWTPSGMLQAEDRIHRIGQTKPVTITYLDAKDTVDEHLAEVLDEKYRLIKAVVDDEAAESLMTVDAVVARMAG